MSEGDVFYERVGSAARKPRMVNETAAAAPVVSGGVTRTENRVAALSGGRSWAESDNTFWAVQKSCNSLPVGVYRMGIWDNVGATFIKVHNDTDTLIPLPDCASAEILDEIRHFKTLQADFRSHGFLYKRGILMWGPPGSGKTSTLQQLIRLLVEDFDSIAVIIENPEVASHCLAALRNIEPDRQIVGVMEDLDALTERYNESAFLSLLDGESQVDNIVFVATTNYPERLDRRFVDRPSRFDTVRRIGMPSKAAREAYLRAKLPTMAAAQMEYWVDTSDGFSIAHLRELIILTQCFGKTADDALARLRSSIKAQPSSTQNSDFAAGFGFTGNKP